MTHKEFLQEVCGKFENIPYATMKEISNAMQEVITDAIKDEDKLTFFPGFDIWGQRTKGHETTNPRTGERMYVPPHIEPKAKFGHRYRRKVWEGFGNDTDQP